MNKLQKPTFIKNMSSIIVSIITGVTSIIPFFIPSITAIKINRINLSWYILVIIILGVSTIYTCIYIYNVHKFYKQYEEQFNDFLHILKNNEEILKDNERLKKNYNRLLIDKKELMDNFYILLDDIRRGTLPVTDYEKVYLSNLYDSFENKINKLKERNENSKYE